MRLLLKFAIRLRKFGTTFHTSTEKLFIEPKCEDVTLIVYWRIFVWNVTSKNLPLVFRLSNRQEHIPLCRQNDRRNLNPFHLFYLFLLSQWRNNENNIIRTICITFDVAQRLINQNFPKAGRQNWNKVLWSKRMINNLSLFMFERRNSWKYF